MIFRTALVYVVILCLLYACGVTPSRSAQQSAVLSLPAGGTPLIPDPKLTPGDVLPGVTAADVCRPGYAKSVRDVPQSEKVQVYREYHMDPRHHPPTEIDHSISLENGGSNSIKNLWPEVLHIQVGSVDEGGKVKDTLEDKIHSLICGGKITLQQGQEALRGDWRPAYLKYVGPFPKFVAH